MMMVRPLSVELRMQDDDDEEDDDGSVGVSDGDGEFAGDVGVAPTGSADSSGPWPREVRILRDRWRWAE